MYKSIKIKNLRAITELDINNLEQVNLFVGQNNCGKTSLLKALFFLIGATNPGLPVRANTFRGLEVINSDWWCTFFRDLDTGKNIEISGKVHRTKDEQNLIIRPKIIKKDLTAEAINTNAIDMDTDSASLKQADQIEGLEQEYTSKKNPKENNVSSIVQKNNKFVTEGVKERSIRGIFVCLITVPGWQDRFDSVQRKKQVGPLVEVLKEIEPNISDLRLSSAGILEAGLLYQYRYSK